MLPVEVLLNVVVLYAQTCRGPAVKDATGGVPTNMTLDADAAHPFEVVIVHVAVNEPAAVYV